MRRALASQPEERHRLHRYDLSQFGVEEAESAARFAAYCDRFGLAARRKYAARRASGKAGLRDRVNNSKKRIELPELLA